MRTFIIFVLIAALVFVSDRLVRIENQRYALIVGMCQRDGERLPVGLDRECLQAVQTRTSWAWQLYYGLTNPVPSVPLRSE